MDTESYEGFVAQKNLQQDHLNTQTSLAAPQLRELQNQYQAVLVEQTNPKRVIREIEMSLMNCDEDDNGVIIRYGEPLLNELGISRLRFVMRSIINQNTILSHLEEKEIARIIVEKSNNIIDDMTLNWREYGVKDKIILDHIIDSVVFPAFFALKRAWQQNEKNFLGKVTVETLANNPN